MNWFNILKMPPYDTTPDIRNEEQYNAASLEERRLWHNSQSSAYDRRLQALRTQHTVDLTDVENPIYQEMKQYQNLRNFHKRQSSRLRKCIASGRTECGDFYSEELEGSNRIKAKLRTTPAGQNDPYVELSLEQYNELTDNQKTNYHVGMFRRGIDKKFHKRMRSRILENLELPTFPSPKYGGEPVYNKEYSKEEYLRMSNEDKAKFHIRMQQRAGKENNLELKRFHNKMRSRLKTNKNRKKGKDKPTYYSPEDEQEEQ